MQQSARQGITYNKTDQFRIVVLQKRIVDKLHRTQNQRIGPAKIQT